MQLYLQKVMMDDHQLGYCMVLKFDGSGLSKLIIERKVNGVQTIFEKSKSRNCSKLLQNSPSFHKSWMTGKINL